MQSSVFIPSRSSSMLSRAGHRLTVVCPPSHCRYDPATKSNGCAESCREASRSCRSTLSFPKFEKFNFGELYFYFCCLACKLMVARVLRLRMSAIRGKRHQPPSISLSLRGRNEIDELLFAVHVELSIDIAPVGDGRSFRYYQFFLNAREGVALRKNDENLEFSRG